MRAPTQWNLNQISYYGFLLALLASISDASSSAASSSTSSTNRNSQRTSPPPPPPPPFSSPKASALDDPRAKWQRNSQIRPPPPPPPRNVNSSSQGTNVVLKIQNERKVAPPPPPPPSQRTALTAPTDQNRTAQVRLPSEPSSKTKLDDSATMEKRSGDVPGVTSSLKELNEKPTAVKKPPPPPPPPRNVGNTAPKSPLNQSDEWSLDDMRRRIQDHDEAADTEKKSSPSTLEDAKTQEDPPMTIFTNKVQRHTSGNVVESGQQHPSFDTQDSQLEVDDDNMSPSETESSESKKLKSTDSSRQISTQQRSSPASGTESTREREMADPLSAITSPEEPRSGDPKVATPLRGDIGHFERMKSSPSLSREVTPTSAGSDGIMPEHEAPRRQPQQNVREGESQDLSRQQHTAMNQNTAAAPNQPLRPLSHQRSQHTLSSQNAYSSSRPDIGVPSERNRLSPPPKQIHQPERGQPLPSRPSTIGRSTSKLPPKSSSPPPVFKSLWSRVEKGLDDLASLDDRVAYQAQKLMSTAAKTPWRRHTNRPQPQRPQSSLGSAKASIAPAKNRPLGTPQARWQQQNAIQKREAQVASRQSSLSKTAIDPSQPSATGHPYASSSYSFLDKARAKYTPAGEKDPVRTVDWGGLSGKTRWLMPANGGASVPNDSQKFNRPGPQKDSPLEIPNGPGGNKYPSDASSSASPANEASTRQPVSPGLQGPPQSLTQQQYPGMLPTRPTSSTADPIRRDVPSQQQSSQPQKSQSPTSSFSEKFRSSMAAPAKSSVSAPTRSSPLPSSYDDDNDEKASIFSRIAGAIPVPRFPSSVRRLFKLGKGGPDNMYASLDAWNAEDADVKMSKGILGIFRRRGKTGVTPVVPGKKGPANDGMLPKQVKSLLVRSDKGEGVSLLSTADEKRVRKVGKARAIMDVITLGFLLVGLRQLQGLEDVPFPSTIHDFASLTVPGLLACMSASFDTWASLAIVSAILTMLTSSLLFDGRINTIATDVAGSAEAEATYSRLFLRLVSSTSTDREIPAKVHRAASVQVMALGELSRLRSFVTYILSTILFMTVTVIQPLIWTTFETLLHIATLEEWRKWPIQLAKILSEARTILANGSRELTSLIEGELKSAGNHPMKVAFKVSIMAAMVAVVCLPGLEKKRKIAPIEDSEEENTEEVSRRMAEQITNLGASSAGRLALLSKRGWVEGSIERWRIVQEESTKMVGESSFRSLFRRLGYSITSWIILAMPLLVFGVFLNVPVTGWSSASLPHWEALLEVAVLLLFTNGLVSKAVAKAVEANDLRPDILGFLESLSRTGEEIVHNEAAQRPLSTSMNPTAGLLVKDLWAAHTVKRAWAVRGANLSCKNGEVLVLLGDDGAGKSRILTALAESIILPPKRALTATKVRGSVAFGGIDVTQWDQAELKKRVGVFLNDVRTMADRADMWSGMSLEEILEPGDVLKALNPIHTSSATEKACMVLGLKITGLYWSLLPRLPSKLSSVLTANEEDLRPSPLRPRYNVLSPTEWSKLMMAKLIAQQIYDNENSSGSSDKVDNSLIGSLFLLDDATILLSETEETKLLRELRRTGAATVLTSNKWATGRLADRIAVVKDGAIAEFGTHNELLSRGPQHSLYAAKWQAMTAA